MSETPPTTDIVTEATADLATPESELQYQYRTLLNRLPPRQSYAIPCLYGDRMYWMDS